MAKLKLVETPPRSEAQEYQRLRGHLKKRMKIMQHLGLYERVSELQILLNDYTHSNPFTSYIIEERKE